MQDDGNKDKTLANRVSRLIVDAFNKLSVKSGKPGVRSNGVTEWTVLAGIAMIEIDETANYKVSPICFATGVKALPDKVRQYSQGSMVHDMHAEILTLRLFNWYLLKEMSLLIENDQYSSQIIEKREDEAKFSLRENIKLALYISEPPCGDASMTYIADEREPWQETKPEKRRKVDNDEGTVLRGRANFDQLGKVRTKPGRADSLISLSKSCSDKLCMKQLIGINNCFTSYFMKDPIFIDYLVLPQSKACESDLTRCFYDRFQSKDHPVKYMKHIRCDDDGFEFQKPETCLSKVVPSQLSLLRVIPNGNTQVLNNGVKNGSFIKGKPPKPTGESFICNKQFYLIAKTIANLGNFHYSSWKLQNHQRESLKEHGRSILKYWPRTSIDDFQV